jgi:hypothetical protein
MLLREGLLDSLDEVADWDMAAIGEGRLPAVGTVSTQPLLLVCTHSKRDQCCAQHGRALLAGLRERVDGPWRERIWESSHIGGHRFAPVTLSLPCGIVHGRTSIDEGVELVGLLAQGRVMPERMRGRSAFPAPLQSAEIAVRRSDSIDALDALDVLLVRHDRVVPVPLGWAVPTGSVDLEVRHVDGRAWRVRVEGRRSDALRSESCGADPVPMHEWSASAPRPVAAWL